MSDPLPQTVLEHLIEMKGMLAAQGSKLDLVEKAVNGNGNPGLVQKQEELKGRVDRFEGMSTAAVWLGGGAFGIKVLEWLYAGAKAIWGH